MSRSLFPPEWNLLDERAFGARLLAALPMERVGDDPRRRVVRSLAPGAGLRLGDHGAREETAGLRLELEPQPGDARWWLDVLSPHVASLSFRTAGMPARRAWDWPLDVAVYGGDPTWAEVDELKELRNVSSLDASTLIEVLCLPLTLESALALPPPMLLPRVHSVVVMRGVAFPGGELQMLDALRTRWRADAATLLCLDEGAWSSWLVGLTAKLAHDRPLDDALFEVARQAGAPRPVCVGRPDAFANTLLSQYARQLLTRHSAKLGFAAEQLLQRIATSTEATFAHETHGAREVANLRKRLEPSAPHEGLESVAPALPARHVVARLRYPVFSPVRNELAVQIRVPDRTDGAAVASRAFEEPADWVQGEAHRLHVLFQDLTTPLPVRPAVQSKSIVLPPRGSSDEATFELNLPPPEVDFVGRIIVLEYPARILQTLTYRIEGRDRTERLEVETMARGLEQLDGPRSEMPLSFIVNEDATREHLVSAIRDGEATVVPLSEYTNVASFIGAKLDELADDQGSKKPYQPGSDALTLLVELALQGSELRKQLVKFFHVPAQLTQVQIVAADPNQILPLEFCYDGPAPDEDATLCTDAATRIEQGATSCTCREDRKVVCPLRFWGLSRVIERHAAAEPARGGDLLIPRPSAGKRSLSLGGSVVWVMDPAVGSPADRKKLFDTLHRAVETKAVRADSFDEWIDAMRGKPSVVAAVMHHGEEEGGIYELASEQKKMARVDERYVEPAELVVFLGCNTAQSNASFSPTSHFIVNGATIVVGTYSRTVGRFAAICAKEIVLAARAAKPKERFAEVFRRARGRLLAQGYTMAMSLVALGDADCIVERGR